MTNSEFYKQFGVVFMASAILLFFFNWLKQTTDYQILSISGFIFFNLLSLGAFFLGKKSLNSSNKFLFNNLVIVNVMIKMFISVAIIIVFQKYAEPATNWFVLPFLTLYLVYTIFETYILTKLPNLLDF